MLITRLCAWLLMMTFPAYFTTTFIMYHRPQTSLAFPTRASICAPSTEYYESLAQLINMSMPSPFSARVNDDLDDGLPYDSEWRRAMAKKLYKGTESATGEGSAGSAYVLRKHQLVEPKAALEPELLSNETDIEALEAQWDDWYYSDLIALIHGKRKPRHMEGNTWFAILLEVGQFVLVLAMVAVFVLGTSEIIGRNLESDEAPPERKVQFVRTGGDGGQDQPDQNPMDVVPQNAPPMLLPLTAEHGAPSYAQSGRPFPPLNPHAAPELPWRVKEKAKAKAKGKEKTKEKEKRTRAMTAEAEQQKRRDAHQAKHFRGVLDDIKEKKAAKQRGEFGNRYIPLAGSDGEPEVVLD